MPSREGSANRLKWDPASLLGTLSRSVTKAEMVEGFKSLPVEKQIYVLGQLHVLSASPDPRQKGGGNNG